jgi:oligopeptide/dipeptide ABC transporter ATP-binding protein
MDATPGQAAAALEISGLCVALRNGAAVLDGVGLSVAPGRTLALVGESGSGKSMTALAIMGLLAGGVRATGGSIRLNGREMLGAPEPAWRAARGAEIAMIFQDPMGALDPVLPVGRQVIEAVRAHRAIGARAARAAALDLLARVRLPDPARLLGAYPHQMSGGMCQRVMIAMALAGHPRLLIADEPTTALDVTVQAQILDLLTALRAEEGMAMLLITHDLGLVAGYAERVAVMYAGRIVEEAPTDLLFRAPRHPYTKLLLEAAPRLSTGDDMSRAKRRRFAEIPGRVPEPGAWPPGCGFAPRCPRAAEACRAAPPPLRGDVHRHACLLEPVP